MEIEITPGDTEWPLTFGVQVSIDDTVRSQHVVTLTEGEYRDIDGTVEPRELVSATIKFLLDRETPEAILERFSLTDVIGYFPDYPKKVADYL